MPETCRLFIAIPLPNQVKQTLQDVQKLLKRDNHPVRWVAPNAMHLTLQFLGETNVNLLPQINDVLQHVVNQSVSHTLVLEAPSIFPHLRRPSVIWVGVGGATEPLIQLQATLARALESLGFTREARPFFAHLTIGRVRRDATGEQQEQLGRAISALPPISPVSWQVTQIMLFQSELLQSGPRYTERYAVELPG